MSNNTIEVSERTITTDSLTLHHRYHLTADATILALVSERINCGDGIVLPGQTTITLALTNITLEDPDDTPESVDVSPAAFYRGRAEFLGKDEAWVQQQIDNDPRLHSDGTPR